MKNEQKWRKAIDDGFATNTPMWKVVDNVYNAAMVDVLKLLVAKIPRDKDLTDKVFSFEDIRTVVRMEMERQAEE